MAVVIVIDDEGNERMRRDSSAPVLTPPPGMDEAEWAGLLVRDLLRQLASESGGAVEELGRLSS